MLTDQQEDDAKRDALAAVLRSGVLGEQSRLRILLTYLVDEEIAGRGSRLKAYSIATEALGRREDFDPATDSIVRVEAARLRQALALHNATAGPEVPLLIDIPKGRYRPAFVPNPARSTTSPLPVSVPPDPAPPPRTRRGAWLRRNAAFAAVALALLFSGAFAGALVAIRIDTVTRHADDRPDRLRLVIRPGSDTPAVASALIGVQEVASAFSGYEVVPESLDAPEEEGRWPESYELLVRPAEDGAVRLELFQLASRDLVSSRVIEPGDTPVADDHSLTRLTPLQVYVAGLVGIDGRIESDYRTREDILPAYRCIGLVEDYFDTRVEADRAAALDCIAERLKAGDTFFALQVGRALLLRDAAQADGAGPARDAGLEQALEAANRATMLYPYGAEGYYAKATVHYAMGDREEFLKAARTAVELNPYESFIIGGVASRLAHLGRSGEALVYLRRAEALNPEDLDWRNYAFFLVHFNRGSMERAAARARELEGSREPIYLAAQVVAQHAAGDEKEARAALDLLRQVNGGKTDLTETYRRMHFDPELIAKLTRAVDRASSI